MLPRSLRSPSLVFVFSTAVFVFGCFYRRGVLNDYRATLKFLQARA